MSYPSSYSTHSGLYVGRSFPAHCRGLTLLELIVVLTVLVALGSILVPLLSGGNLTIDLDGEGGSEEKSIQQITTETTLARVADAIVGSGGYVEVMRYARDGADTQFVGYGTGLPWPSPGEVAGGRTDHPQLRYLFVEPTDLLDYAPPENQFYNPVLKIGWRGLWLSFDAAGRYQQGDPDPSFTDDYGEDDDPTPFDGWGNPVVIQLPNADSNELGNVRLVSAGKNGIIDTPATVLEPDNDEKNDDLVLYLFREDPFP